MGAIPTGLTVEVIGRSIAVERLSAEVEDLANRALESNVFAEPLMLLPALELIDVDVPLLVLCVRGPAGLLLGVVVFVLQRLRSGVPLVVLKNWLHRYCFLGTPLIDAARARPVLEAIAAWIESEGSPAGGVAWDKISWDGPFGQLIRETFTPARQWVIDVSTVKRALLVRQLHQKAGVSGRHAKDYRRMERRLSELGELGYEVLEPRGDWQAWLNEFLILEARGWKGTAGSAISSQPADREFFRRVVHQAHATQRLQMLALRLDGKALAMKLNLRSVTQSYSLKIAHDEQYSQYSPGVLLELFNIRVFRDESAQIQTMDSCADPNHSMIDRLWTDRREISYVTAVRRGLLLRAFVKMRPFLRNTRRALRLRAASSGLGIGILCR